MNLCQKSSCRFSSLVALFLICAFTANVGADVVYDVTINGVVEFNQIGAPPLGTVAPGETVTLSFQIDSENFVDSLSFPTRGYEIDQTSFLLAFSGGTSIGLQDPFPGGQTPYFVIRDNDPAVDGFFVSTNIDFPTGVPLQQTGFFEQFRNNFSVTYNGNTLSSLDIADAEGKYDFAGLNVFNWTIDDGPANAAGFNFSNLTIARVPEPTMIIPLLCLDANIQQRLEPGVETLDRCCRFRIVGEVNAIEQVIPVA